MALGDGKAVGDDVRDGEVADCGGQEGDGG
jgi:hypothetical protein